MSTWANRPWLTGLASFEFDLDVGQKVQAVYPTDELTNEELTAIAYNAIPDSSGGSGAQSCVSDWCASYNIGADDAAAVTSSESAAALTTAHFTFSRHRRDPRIERGAEQRSAVLISALPYSALLLPLASLLGPSLLSSFDALAPQLLREATSTWPRPRPGKLLKLNVGPQPICGYVPADDQLPDPPPPMQDSLSRASTSGSFNSLRRSCSSALASPSSLCSAGRASFGSNDVSAARSAPQVGLYADVDVAEVFSGQLQHLWPLWEVCMLGRQLLVFAKTPQECSSAVAGLLSLLAPMPYQPDYRPLLSIHDPQVEQVLGGKQHTSEQPVPTLFGATNPFFLRSRTPNLSILAMVPDSAVANTAATGATAQQSPSLRSPSLLPTVTSTAGALSSLLSGGTRKLPAEVLEGREGGMWLAQRGTCAGPDKATLATAASTRGKRTSSRSLTQSVGSGTIALRTHFHALTTAFLAPFCLYCGVLPPWDAANSEQRAALPHGEKDADASEEFHSNEFLQYLDQQGFDPAVLAYCGGKKAARRLYSEFMACPNFAGWLHRALDAAELLQA